MVENSNATWLGKRKRCLTTLTPRATEPSWDPDLELRLKLCVESSHRLSQGYKQGLKLLGKQEVQVGLGVTKPEILRSGAK